jgi:hypothetical protein
MIGFVFRFLWRVLIFILGSLIIWIIVFFLFPVIDSRLPVFITLLIIYCLLAYFIVPNLIRLFRIIIKPNHIPLYATTADGWSSDPVNIVLVSRSKRQLIRSMTRAGWYMADKTTPRTTIKFIMGFVFGLPYPNAPFSSLYLFGRKQDIGFQIPTDKKLSPRHRHHVRFWLLTENEINDHAHVSFWQQVLHLFRVPKKQIWVGAATHDIGNFAFRTRNMQITHKIDANTDIERDFLIASLKNAEAIHQLNSVQAGEPLRFRGQTMGVSIVTDGTLPVVELKGKLFS